MKKLILVLLSVAAMAATNAPPPTAEELDRMFMEAMLLKQYGQYAEAEVRLKKLAAIMPDQPAITKMLAEVQAKQKKKDDEPANVLKRRLDQIILPAVNFREAAPADVVAWLSAEAKRLSPDKEPVNIVWMVPAGVQLPAVTLSLEKVPLATVLRYFCDITGLRYRVDPHAVVIHKPEPPAAGDAQP